MVVTHSFINSLHRTLSGSAGELNLVQKDRSLELAAVLSSQNYDDVMFMYDLCNGRA